MNDQTIKADAGKLRISLVPTEIIRAIARVREYGVNKYGARELWRDVEQERYRDALLRHTLAWWDDPMSEELKKTNGGKWECTPVPKIAGRTAKEAYADMPEKLIEYIKSMPEYDETIFKAITESGRKHE